MGRLHRKGAKVEELPYRKGANVKIEEALAKSRRAPPYLVGRQTIMRASLQIERAQAINGGR